MAENEGIKYTTGVEKSPLIKKNYSNTEIALAVKKLGISLKIKK